MSSFSVSQSAAGGYKPVAGNDECPARMQAASPWYFLTFYESAKITARKYIDSPAKRVLL